MYIITNLGHVFLVIGIIPAWAADSAFFWLLLATAYTKPAKKPTLTAETDPRVTASPKKIMPEAATGSLFNAPTMLRGNQLRAELEICLGGLACTLCCW